MIRPTVVGGSERFRAPGILVLYHFRPPYAATVLEHAGAISRHSRFPVWSINVDLGFPPGLDRIEPAVIVLHYSLFGSSEYLLDDRFLDFTDRSASSYRIAFFQDEYYYCAQRFAFVDRHRIDCIYTLVEPAHWEAVYGLHTHVPGLMHTIPGYVSDDLIRTARARGRPDIARRIDVGYRARSLPFSMGGGSQEKRDIGVKFKELVAERGLALDIEVDEPSRLYGDRWNDFMANCRGMLGVEAGVSIFDIDDVVRPAAERLLAATPSMTFEEMRERLLEPWEGNIPYRTVSPRHFEAAAYRVVQILFEGRYSDVLTPMEHYLPLRKDFSNLDEVLRLFADADLRRSMTERAYADIIGSGRHSYRTFVAAFDDDLARRGIDLRPDPPGVDRARRAIADGVLQRRLRRDIRLGRRALGRQPVGKLANRMLRKLGR